jgi:hypothetical protein
VKANEEIRRRDLKEQAENVIFGKACLQNFPLAGIWEFGFGKYSYHLN